VKSPLWFRYDMNVLPDCPMTLICTYSGDEKDCTFDILIDGVQLTEQTLSGRQPGDFVAVTYGVPGELLKGKKRVAVMLRGKDKPTPELFECAMVRTAR
jgi:hypothetical protein